MAYNLYNIGIHLEISSNCNSKCLDCNRYIVGTDTVIPFIDIGSKGLMTLDMINNIFTEELCKNIRYVNFTGTYGDFITHPKCHEILNLIADKIKDVRDIRINKGLEEKIQFIAETNGGLHHDDWWTELSNIIKTGYNKSSYIIFGLDGVDENTHQKYRRGVSFSKAVNNASILINNNVNTDWSMILFSYNENLVNKAKEQSKILGFRRFKIRRSRLRHNRKEEIPNLKTKNKNISNDILKIPEIYKNISIPNINEEDIITCEWLNKNQISIDYTGRVWQCCYFSTFYHFRPSLENYNISIEQDYNKMQRLDENLSFYENQYNDNWNNIKKYKLEDILNHDFFTNDLPKSILLNNVEYPRIKRCEKFCSKKTKILDNIYKEINDKIVSKNENSIIAKKTK